MTTKTEMHQTDTDWLYQTETTNPRSASFCIKGNSVLVNSGDNFLSFCLPVDADRSKARLERLDKSIRITLPRYNTYK